MGPTQAAVLITLLTAFVAPRAHAAGEEGEAHAVLEASVSGGTALRAWELRQAYSVSVLRLGESGGGFGARLTLLVSPDFTGAWELSADAVARFAIAGPLYFKPIGGIAVAPPGAGWPPRARAGANLGLTLNLGGIGLQAGMAGVYTFQPSSPQEGEWVLSAGVGILFGFGASSPAPVPSFPDGPSAETFSRGTWPPGEGAVLAAAPAGGGFVGRVYVLRAFYEGKPASYTGATARELRDRFSKHQWKKLILAETTTITVQEVHAEINVAASGRGTVRSGVNEALRAAEQTVLEHVRDAGGDIAVLNQREAAMADNVKIWTKRHKVKLGGKSTIRGGFKLSAVVGLTLLDIFMMYRDEKASHYAIAPHLLEDQHGVFMLQHGTDLFVFNTYLKHYITGDLAGEDVKIDPDEFNELKQEADALWGYLDFAGDWVPGLLRRSFPVVDPYKL